jgi:hypothetical protein
MAYKKLKYWIINHALRNEVKNGNPVAIKLIGDS